MCKVSCGCKIRFDFLGLFEGVSLIKDPRCLLILAIWRMLIRRRHFFEAGSFDQNVKRGVAVKKKLGTKDNRNEPSVRE